MAPLFDTALESDPDAILSDLQVNRTEHPMHPRGQCGSLVDVLHIRSFERLYILVMLHFHWSDTSLTERGLCFWVSIQRKRFLSISIS